MIDFKPAEDDGERNEAPALSNIRERYAITLEEINEAHEKRKKEQEYAAYMREKERLQANADLRDLLTINPELRVVFECEGETITVGRISLCGDGSIELKESRR